MIKSTLALVVALVLLGSFAEAKRYKNLQGGLKEGLKYRIPGYDLSQSPVADAPQPQWYNQTVDHFDPLNTATFPQLYYINDDYYVPGGPIFVLLGGEGPVGPQDVGTHFVLPNYAAKFDALIVAVEHRFYGQSMPMGDLSTGSLRLLTSTQALADYAQFVQFILQQYNAPNTSVISFGGSYSGSLSAWFRAKYPTLVDGSIATSAPVKAQLDFPQYFEVVQASIGPKCAKRVQTVNQIVYKMLQTESGLERIYQLFNTCTPIVSDNDIATFMSSLTDGVCEIVQYNNDNVDYLPFNVDKMCSMIMEGNDTVEDMLNSYANFVLYFNDFSGQPCTSASYDQMITEMQNTTTNSDVAAARSWTWQTCVEFGYYQTGESANQPFSSTISLQWFLQQCNDIFGLPLTPNINVTNNVYGSTDLKSSKIIFPTGTVDPWHILGITEQFCADEPAKYMTGTAHCADLYPPSPNDVPDLTEVREMEVSLIEQWLHESC